MNKLSLEEFESVLRPPFKENEMMAAIASAIPGAAVGEIQMLLMPGRRGSMALFGRYLSAPGPQDR
jgi:hypothetical protein